jgi:hypothetical protein
LGGGGAESLPALLREYELNPVILIFVLFIFHIFFCLHIFFFNFFLIFILAVFKVGAFLDV